MKSKIKNFKVKPSYYLCGPLALVAFFLMDFIGGINFPGYDWMSKTTSDLTALNSYDFALSYVFCIIYVLLTLFSAFCIYKFFKASKFNSQIKLGIKLFVIGIVLLAISFAGFFLPEAGRIQELSESTILGTTEQTVQDDDGNVTNTYEKISLLKTKQNVKQVAKKALHYGILGKCLLIAACALLVIVGLSFMVYGGFIKKGNTLFACVAIFSLVLIIYSLVAMCIYETSTFGVNSRFLEYPIVLLTAFFGSWIYISSIEE